MHVIPEEVLSDLRLRFLSFAREKGKKMALCRNIEAARSFYLKHYCPQDLTESEQPDLKEFIRIFLTNTPSLNYLLPELEEVYNRYIKDKKTTPTYGGLILNKEKKQVLLVRDPLIKAWDFPKGKLNYFSHLKLHIARIIHEETGLVIPKAQYSRPWASQKATPDEAFTFLEVVHLSDEEIDSQMLKGSAKWFTVKELEAWEYDGAEKTSYTRVCYFLSDIRYFLKDEFCK